MVEWGVRFCGHLLGALSMWKKGVLRKFYRGEGVDVESFGVKKYVFVLDLNKMFM